MKTPVRLFPAVLEYWDHRGNRNGNFSRRRRWDYYGHDSFCSHGGGRFGQSLTTIEKLAPDATMGEEFSIHYSSGSSQGDDVAAWLETNEIVTN